MLTSTSTTSDSGCSLPAAKNSSGRTASPADDLEVVAGESRDRSSIWILDADVDQHERSLPRGRSQRAANQRGQRYTQNGSRRSSATMPVALQW